MKKYAIAILSTLTLAGCTQGLKQSEENPMMGNWVCVTNYYDYYDVGVRTNDYLQFDKDGVYSSKGVIALPIIENPLFVYHQESFGKWEYKNNELTMIPAHMESSSAHSKETVRKLKKDKKLREIEQVFANSFERNVGTMTFKIIKKEKDIVLQEQELGGKRYFPFCMKAETVQEKIKNGEIKLNPNY
ncbi:hypothetical protein BKG92_10395 [Rodentibacter ratti]|uniref:Lipoprotein n=1 Tax=Rodentibacter ratti TaxID=1906745 RepID=A0A1V3KSL7_9PAST|nr:hypothetical protein [Rodentibacter ratti]OOF80667.1 hypothetical protein BKG92_10395 [Rodentibacter ratti]